MNIWKRLFHRQKTFTYPLYDETGFIKEHDPKERLLITQSTSRVSRAVSEPGLRTIEITVPDFCQRCKINPATISARDLVKHTLEFICITCRNNDRHLRNLPIKTKFTDEV